ncbi:septum formation family protein [Williamsia sterculiae]|uniref:Septum formation n=1 Tax=Williamsia sterculiae TaxID=1344003 RepID=A0A1N7H8Z3_9NOCA|nr:septum formation family protein [Williamsia sterculiae]SIS21316.1 Septum formation [Williamsia sterculiae]
MSSHTDGTTSHDGTPTRDEAPHPEQSHRPSLRQRILAHPVRVILAAVVVGAIVFGAVAVATGLFDHRGNVDETGIGGDERGPAPNAFNRSVPGDCLNWPAGDPGKPAKVDCAAQHYFEVAGVLDTGVYPGSQFSSTAPWPGAQFFSQFRDQQCPPVVNGYLGGKYDPNGRFSVGLMYPSQAQWQEGERSLRCGLQVVGPGDTLAQFLGRVAGQDQSLQWPVGTCVGIDKASRQPTAPASCAEPHAFQVTGLVNLGKKFGPAPAPSRAQQNEYLTTTCPTITEGYLGGRKKFTATTLNVQWSTIEATGWTAGSRTAVCYIGLPAKDGGFATLVGDARQSLLIDGKVPQPAPEAPPGRVNPTPVPLPSGIQPNPEEIPAPVGGGGGGG